MAEEEVQVSEQDLNNAVQTLEMYKAQLETLAKHRELIESSLNEHKRGLETLKEYSGAKKGTEILVPIGGGTYLPAVVGKKKVMLALGAEYYSEEDFENVECAKEERDYKILLHAGNIFDYQNPEKFWRTVKELNDKGEKIKLRFVGTIQPTHDIHTNGICRFVEFN